MCDIGHEYCRTFPGLWSLMRSELSSCCRLEQHSHLVRGYTEERLLWAVAELDGLQGAAKVLRRKPGAHPAAVPVTQSSEMPRHPVDSEDRPGG